MTNRWAVVRDGVVETVLKWAGGLRNWRPPEGTQAVFVGSLTVLPHYVYDETTNQFSPPPFDPAAIAAELEDAVDSWIEQVARAAGYGSEYVPATVSIATYLNSSNDLWRRQAQAFVDWRDSVWENAIQIQRDALMGLRPIPSAAELLQLLPQPNIPMA